MAHVEDARMPEDDVEGERKDGVEAYAHAHVDPVGVEEEGQNGDKQAHGDGAVGPLVRKVEKGALAHSLSAVRSPRRPVGRMMRMRMSTRKATASFQATAR